MIDEIIIYAVFAFLMNSEYKCVRWVWWWDTGYQYKIAHCLEWKKVEKK
jgi:hypothetical protein